MEGDQLNVKLANNQSIQKCLSLPLINDRDRIGINLKKIQQLRKSYLHPYHDPDANCFSVPNGFGSTTVLAGRHSNAMLSLTMLQQGLTVGHSCSLHLICTVCSKNRGNNLVMHQQ